MKSSLCPSSFFHALPTSFFNGFGTMATRLLCRYGFEVLQLHKIYLYANENNSIAHRTYEKVGFKLEGRLRDERICDGEFEDRLYYGLLSSELETDSLPLCLSGGTTNLK